MQAHILRFVNILRGSGLRICPDELLSALAGTEFIDFRSKEQFKTLLQITLIKKAEDLKEFNRLFDLYFLTFEKFEETLSSPLSQTDLAEPVQAVLEQANGIFSPWFRQLVSQGLSPLVAALLDMSKKVGLSEIRYPLQTKQFVQKMRREFEMEHWADESRHLLAQLDEGGVSAAERTLLEQEILKRMDLFDSMLEDYINSQTEAFLKKNSSKNPSKELMEKGFGALTSWEIQAMQQPVQELVKKIRDDFSLRQRRRRRGRFDLKHTLRKSLVYDGLPIEVVFRKRNRSKGKIVVLCDVSSSVWNASRFMLHLLYSLQDQFDKVRSFVFVDQLGEVTKFFERQEVSEAIETALNSADIPYYRYTDYGSVFRQFCDEYSDIVNRKTTFIVIGDGRNNFFDPEERFLARIRSRARRTIWLNPESIKFWRSGDSVIHKYSKNCDEVRECRNLKQLIEFVDELTV